MRSRDTELNSNWNNLYLPLNGGQRWQKRKVQAADSEGLLRIIQSIPSPKAEPFKRWLAKVGSERLEEIENPELASKRAKYLYKAKGYPEDWIEKRMRSIAIREELTDEWKQRGIGLAGGHLLQYFVFPLADAKFFYFAQVDMSVITGIQGFSLKNYT